MKELQVLLVEDSEGDILLTQEAFEEENYRNMLSVVKDGAAAVDYLSRKGIYADQELPDLVLLDINLPKLNGHEVLNYIKTTAAIKNIPVIMLTTSSSNADVVKAYSAGANSYITKSDRYEIFIQSIKILMNYWTNVAILPEVDMSIIK